MIFNKDSFLVQLYVKKIKEDGFRLEDVPNLFNLKEIVQSVITSQQD